MGDFEKRLCIFAATANRRGSSMGEKGFLSACIVSETPSMRVAGNRT